jgi:hypothetical protein
MASKSSKSTPTPVIPSTSPMSPAYKPPTPFDWTSSSGRPSMDMQAIMGAAMPLAGQVQMPQMNTAAPPISGNFWDTVASPDMMLMAINSLPKTDSKSKNAVDPFGFGRDFTSIMNGSPMAGKTGMPGSTGGSSSSKSSDGKSSGGMDMSKVSMNNPFMMQAFLQSPAYQALRTKFSPEGVINNNAGTIPFY